MLRPLDPAAASDAEWTDYLFMRKNRKGSHWEQWHCIAGCGQWFKAERNTVTHDIHRTALLCEQIQEA